MANYWATLLARINIVYKKLIEFDGVCRAKCSRRCGRLKSERKLFEIFQQGTERHFLCGRQRYQIDGHRVSAKIWATFDQCVWYITIFIPQTLDGITSHSHSISGWFLRFGTQSLSTIVRTCSKMNNLFVDFSRAFNFWREMTSKKWFFIRFFRLKLFSSNHILPKRWSRFDRELRELSAAWKASSTLWNLQCSFLKNKTTV